MGLGAPLGTVTFLFTDIEGSTRLWQDDEVAMRAALERHDVIVRAAIDAHEGYVFSTGGDGLAAAFARAGDAVAAAIAAQATLAAERWPEPAPIRVRMGVHTGEADHRDGDYFGTAVNRAARLMAIGHGGQVLCSETTASLLGDGADVRDLGEHRLRDLARPVRVFQLGPGSFGPLRSLDVLPGNLPVLETSFVGRAEDLATVAAELRDHRLVTLTGVGGVGKTRLAVQVAADAAPRFAHGAWLCELAAAGSEDALVPLVAGTLGVLQRSEMTLAESIVDFLRAREVLLVLDNCEHLLDAAAELAELVLAGAPGVRLLATSREGLGIPSEHVRPLRSLPVGDADAGAVRLFVERARTVDPEFALDEATGPAVVEVCRRLDGIPLAIELAAARAASMGPAEIAGHLDERFRLLTGGRRGRVERHQTLRAAIEWSYSLLPDAERTVFDRLGAFPASFDEPAAVAVCSGEGVERWDVIDALGALVSKSMVGVERAGGTARYQLLETLRHFARDQIGAAGTIELLRRRHARYYAEFAERCGEGLMTTEELQWRPRVAAELDNFRAATMWASDAPQTADLELGARVLGGLCVELNIQPSFGIQSWAVPALARVEELGPSERSAVLAACGVHAWLTGDFALGAALGDRALAEWAGPPRALAQALVPAAFCRLAMGDQDGALESMFDVMGRLQAAGPGDYMLSGMHTTASWLVFHIGDHARARAEADEALSAARRAGCPSVLAMALATYARSGATGPEDALAAAEEALRLIAAGAGDTVKASALQTTAMARLDLGDVPGAVRDALRAVDFDVDNGNRSFVANDLWIAARALAVTGEARAAATLSGALVGPVLGHMPMYFSEQAHLATGTPFQERLRERLGDEPYLEARERGVRMSYDEVVALALESLRRATERDPGADGPLLAGAGVAGP